MGGGVAGDLVSLVEVADVGGGDASGGSHEGGVEVEGRLEVVSVEDVYEPAVGLVAVVIGEGEGLGAAFGEEKRDGHGWVSTPR